MKSGIKVGDTVTREGEPWVVMGIGYTGDLIRTTIVALKKVGSEVIHRVEVGDYGHG